MSDGPPQNHHALTASESVAALKSDIRTGLTLTEVAQRLDQYGANSLPEAPGRSLTRALLAQFTNFLILLLLAATIVAAAIGEYADAVAIAAIVLLSAILGFVQEWRAERAIAALKKMTAPDARVLRDGHVRNIPSEEVVPGDIVLLEVGNYVPADLRLLESPTLQVDEASLTGESSPVKKDAGAVLDDRTEIADRVNCAFAGTMVTYGRGTGVVIATGEESEIGRIAELIVEPEEEQTPLQRRMSELGRYLGAAAIAVSAIVFVAGTIRGLDLLDIALTAISLAVAAVPEGLPAVVVIALALGMQRMAGRNALVRRLAAVETLGSATAIASDKTGTLTRGEMTVTRLYVPGAFIEIGGGGYEPAGDFTRNGNEIDPLAEHQLALLLKAGSLCSDARLEQTDGRWRVVGDTTEGALVVAARKAGLDWEALEDAEPRFHELPFTSERARMTTIHAVEDRAIAYTKGAPEVILHGCTAIQKGDRVESITQHDERDALHANERLASEGLRVLAIAYRPVEREPDLEAVESGMVFVGLAAMQDPPRSEAREAVAACKQAGIRVLMITGDHAATALAIARDLRIAGDRDDVKTGTDLGDLSDESLGEVVQKTSVYARITAEQKVRIVESLRANGEIVAVTGDGVNDAPALVRGDIGAAMGITGTDVAKGVADMVIADDNFASIVAAVEEGRHIFANIRNFVVYLLGGNIGEIVVVFVGVVSGLPLPLLPIQILFVNLVSDGPPALALGVEPGDPQALRRPPRHPDEPLLTGSLWRAVVFRGFVVGASVLAVYVLWHEGMGRSEEASRTVAFASLVLSQVMIAFACRSLERPLLTLSWRSNPWLLLGASASIVALILVVYAPGLADAFEAEALSVTDWVIVAGFSVLPAAAVEMRKVTRWRLRV
jgi:Ca2+-transporting ATPase